MCLLSQEPGKKRTSRYEVKYKVSDTKGITNATTYGLITVNSNIKYLNLELENHDHKEAGMLGVFHAIDVAKCDLFTECCIFIV